MKILPGSAVLLSLFLTGCPIEREDAKDVLVWVPDTGAVAPPSGGGGTPPPGGGGSPPPPPPGGGGFGGPTAAQGPASWEADVPLTTTFELPTISSGQTYWRLVSVEYYPPAVSATQGGDHHINFYAKDAGGTKVANQTAKMTIFGTNDAYAQTKEAVDGFKGNFAMFGTSWCTSDINSGQTGPYAVMMTQDNLPSTRVNGMGMHCNGHMVWTLTFQKSVAP